MGHLTSRELIEQFSTSTNNTQSDEFEIDQRLLKEWKIKYDEYDAEHIKPLQTFTHRIVLIKAGMGLGKTHELLQYAYEMLQRRPAKNAIANLRPQIRDYIEDMDDGAIMEFHDTLLNRESEIPES